MTDPSSSLRPHAAPSPQSTSESAPTSASYAVLPVVDEPAVDYIIKCICGFEDADQNTVCCEKCESWQHTECYYIDVNGRMLSNDELEHVDHFCVDCQPRSLDVQGATDRQRARHEEMLEANEKRFKKGASKSQKKRPKFAEMVSVTTHGWPHGIDVDGAAEANGRNSRDNGIAGRRPKTGHRSSHSRNHSSLPQQALSSSHKRSGSVLDSPTKTPNTFSPGGPDQRSCNSAFVHLYDNDPGDSLLETNLFNDTLITSDLSKWTNDVDALAMATPKFSHPQIFKTTQAPVDSMDRPNLHKEEKIAENLLIDGQHPRWKYLTIDSFAPSGALIGEIKGKIGHMKDYTQNADNEWERLRHPKPFVFFHPRLPIYIDTRSEGTVCRYLRRSCMPNLKMETFLENGSEYHFCWVASRDIESGSELTIGWTLDENARRFLSDGGDHDDYMTNWTTQVFPDFGGCACNSTQCTFARFSKHCLGLAKTETGCMRIMPADRVTGGAENQAGSDEHDESRSTSGSKSASRDMTPIDKDARETGFGTEISAREKRKIAAMEKNFEQLENEKLPVKKKKRNSGGSSSHIPGASPAGFSMHTGSPLNQPATSGPLFRPQPTDVSASASLGNSSTASLSNSASHRLQNDAVDHEKARAHSSTRRPDYVDGKVQTESTDRNRYDDLSLISMHTPKPYISLTKRLILRSQQERQILESRRRAFTEIPSTSNVDAPNVIADLATPRLLRVQADIGMSDAITSQSFQVKATTGAGANSPENHCESATFDDVSKSPPPPWPMQIQSGQLHGPDPPELHVHLPPKISEPSLLTPTLETPTSNASVSPISHNVLLMQPFARSHSGALVHPGPVTKKLSLSEYFNKRKGSSTATDKLAGNNPEISQIPLKLSANISSDNKALISDGGAIVDSPNKDVSDSLVNSNLMNSEGKSSL